MLKSVAEEFCADEPADAARATLLGPFLAEAPSEAVVAFSGKWREVAHLAYEAASRLSVAQHAEANLKLRLGLAGPEVRQALSRAWLAVPGVEGGDGSKARLVLFWDAALQAFKQLNAPVDEAPPAPAGAADHAASDAARDRRVMAVVGGWAVYSLKGRCKNGSAKDQLLLPLLLELIVPEGAGGLSVRDPATLFLLARQQFGGLTALKPGAPPALLLPSTSSLPSYILTTDH